MNLYHIIKYFLCLISHFFHVLRKYIFFKAFNFSFFVEGIPRLDVFVFQHSPPYVCGTP